MQSRVKDQPDGRAYDLDGGALARDMQTMSLSTDERAMSATCVFSTGALDRQGDIVEVAGIRTENHRRNPVVMWGHGKCGLSFPIGKTYDRAGNYTVSIDGEIARQTTYFSQTLPEAEKIFKLICEGIICANSIGFENKVVRPIYNGGKKGLHVLECDLLEISWTHVPVNFEAVTKQLLQSSAWSQGVTLKSYARRAAILKSAEFDESRHPRANDGRFGTKPGEHGGGEGLDVGDDETEDIDDDDGGEDEYDPDTVAPEAEAIASKVADSRPSSIVAANNALAQHGDWYLSFGPKRDWVHADDLATDLEQNAKHAASQVKSLDDLAALNSEFEAQGLFERAVYDGYKVQVVDDVDIKPDELVEVNACAIGGHKAADVLDVNDELDESGSKYCVLPGSSRDGKLVERQDAAALVDGQLLAHSIASKINEVPQEFRAGVAERMNDFLINVDSTTFYVRDFDDAEKFTPVDMAHLENPESLAEHLVDNYDSESWSEAVAWYNALIGEYAGGSERLAVTTSDDGEPQIEIVDEDDESQRKGLRFWSAKSAPKKSRATA